MTKCWCHVTNFGKQCTCPCHQGVAAEGPTPEQTPTPTNTPG